MKKTRTFLQKMWRKIDSFWIMTKKTFQLVWEKIEEFWDLNKEEICFWLLMLWFFISFIFMANHPQ